MNTHHPWVIIIGAGVSGLSLAKQLAAYPTLPGDVIVYDPKPDREVSKTFCFWFQDENSLDIKPEHRWSSWSFSTEATGSNISDSHIHSGDRFSYGMISGGHFKSCALRAITAHPQIHLESRQVMTPPQADYVFDSRPPALDQFRVKQSFVGLEVKLSSPHHLSRVQLMHDLTHIPQGLEFRYVLPLSPDRLLVEYTRFTTLTSDLSELEDAGHSWLRDELKGAYQVKRHERAHIPMGLHKITDHLGIPIGTRAGMTRDSTGYGFIEMIEWARETAQRLVEQRNIKAYQAPLLRRWMDSCLLKIIESRPDLLPKLFMSLSSNLSGDEFASFMMRCDLSDALRVMLSAPKRPFLFSAFGRPEWI